MNRFTKISLQVSLSLVACFALPRGAAGTVDDAQSFALQAAEPYVKEGFQVREDYWGGDLGSGEKKAVRQQILVLDGHRSGARKNLRPHLRFRRKARRAAGQLGKRPFRRCPRHPERDR